MRKTLIVISIIISSLLLILGGSVLVLCHHRVQTSIANCVASNLSERLAVDVNIGKIHYKPLSRLIVDSIYMSDQQNDTLLFVEQLNATFHPLQLLDKRLDITQVTCTRPFVNIQSPKDSTPNFQFLLDLLNDTASFSLRVNVDTLEMIESRLRYNSLLIDRMNLALAMPIFSADSMDITIHNLSMRAKLDQLDAAFEAQLHGGLDSIFADDLKLTYRNKQLFSGDIAVFSPMELDSLYVQANCNDLYCNYALLRDILSQLQVDARNIPNYLLSLGDVHYKGDINGRFEDMFLHGTFSTALGRIQVNGNLQIDSTLTQAEFLGDISSSSFQLGKLVNNVDLGEIAFNANIDGNIDTTSIRHCIANANIQHIEYLGYTYQDILFDGELRGESVSGNFSIKDENINITINGLANWSKKDTRLDITAHLENLCPNAIHLTDKYPEMTLNTTAYISLSTFGKQWIDNLSGHIIIDSLEVQNGSKQAVMEQMKLLIDNDIKEGKKHHRIQLQSDFVTANVSGAFQYTTLASTVQKC